jgi:hypothetical protein
MDYVLRRSLTESDVNFLNITTIEFELFDSHGLKPETQLGFDSGWCDATTGARIISERDRVRFNNVSPEELTLLVLKFGERLKELHDGMKRIYNIDKAEI